MAFKHDTRAHAVLSASASKRWMSCPPSAMLCAEIPDVETDYAREGTLAHELAEWKVNKLLGTEAPKPEIDPQFYSSEMETCTDDYAAYIAEVIAKYEDPTVLVEQRLDLSDYVPDSFGTADCIIVADEVLTVVDYKNGKGVPISAVRNPQMFLYALGALRIFDCLYDISEVHTVIFQPRLENISEDTISVADLKTWAEQELRPKAELAAKGEGEFCAGDHCRFCKVKATCRKRAEYSMILAKYDFTPPALLEDTEIEAILSRCDDLTAWASDVKEYALAQALSGKEWSGFKVVEGRSKREFTDKKKVAAVVEEAGKSPYKKPELLGIIEMTKLLGGAKKFNALLGEWVVKPQGKPTLVPASDKRPVWNTAENDFKEET